MPDVGALVAVLLVVLVLLLALVLALARTRNIQGGGEFRSKPRHKKRKGSPEGFPYLAPDLPPVKKMFGALKSSKVVVAGPRPDRQGYDAVVRRKFPEDSMKCDAISSHFTEKTRARCSIGGKKSPIEAWRDPTLRSKILQFADDNRSSGLKRTMLLREGIQTVGAWCNYYNPAFCLWLYQQFAQRLDMDPDQVRILDPSSGWGDRLLAACAFGAQCYHGYDPNTLLAGSYARIIDTFAPRPDYQVVTAPFESGEVKPESYHIVHTSPPFYDLEKYPAEGGKVSRVHKTYTSWRDDFYLPYLRNSWKAVAPGGIFCLYIANVKSPRGKIPLVTDAENFVNEMGGKKVAMYGFQQVVDLPELGIQRTGRVRSAHVWQKPRTLEIPNANSLELF